MNKQRKKRIQWTSPYFCSLNLELWDDHDGLTYEREHPLNTQPLLIDCLVIKNDNDRVLQNEIGRLFRRYNIVEFKSPDDKLNIDTFFKVMSYAGLYKSYGTRIDAIKESEVTATMIRHGRPSRLFRQLRNRLSCTVSNPYPGIYYITGSIMFATQIIVTSELDDDHHVWLKSLSRHATPEIFLRAFEAQMHLQTEEARTYALSVTDVMLNANPSLLDSLEKGVQDMSLTAYALLGPELRERDSKIEQLQAELDASNKALRKNEQALNKKERALHKKDQALNKKDQALAKQLQRIAMLEEIIRKSGGTVPG